LFDREPGDHPQLEDLLVGDGQQVEGPAQLGVVVSGRGVVTGDLSVLDHLGPPRYDAVLAAQASTPTVVVGADPAGDPEHPAVESCRAGLVAVDAPDGPHHRFAHCVLHVAGVDPAGHIGAQPGIKPAIKDLPGVTVAVASSGNEALFWVLRRVKMGHS
jgi:hypothetical protein